jgi:cob(I)alamin adenosyltransferase
MANKIYTKTGDQGHTSLFGGLRLQKNHDRIEAYGTVDELNAHLGYLRDLLSENPDFSDQINQLLWIQRKLFNMGSILATEPGKDLPVKDFDLSAITFLESAIDQMEAVLPELKNFIIPGGHPLVSYCHIARNVCRRSERRVVTLFDKESNNEYLLIFLNRLSDYLFVLSRIIGHTIQAEETVWKP